MIRGLLASQMLDVGSVYTRAELMQQFAITDATISLDSREPAWGIVRGPMKKLKGSVTRDVVINSVRCLNWST